MTYQADEIRNRLRLVRRRHHQAIEILASVSSSDREKELAIDTLRETTTAFYEIASRMCEVFDMVLGADRALKNAMADKEPDANNYCADAVGQ